MNDVGDSHAQGKCKEESRDLNCKPLHECAPATLHAATASMFYGRNEAS
jgi:hypothetical protein